MYPNFHKNFNTEKQTDRIQMKCINSEEKNIYICIADCYPVRNVQKNKMPVLQLVRSK